MNGGCWLVAWDKVQRPLDLGGLGISNLELMGWALQVRWLWFRETNRKTDTSRPWHALEISVSILPTQRIELSSMDRSRLRHGAKSRRPGHLQSVKSSFGWLCGISVG